MRTWAVLAWVCALVAGVEGQGSTSCNIPPDPVPKLKRPDDPIINSQFEAHVVLNILSRNFTTELHQFFDFNSDHSVIYQREGGVRYWAYAEYQTNEFIAVFPDTLVCQVDSLNTDENRFLFGYKKDSQGAHTPTANAVMHLLQPDEADPIKYMGAQTVRGIPVKVWYACTQWRDMQSTMDVYYYFSDPDKWQPSWAQSGQRLSVPVRAHVTGYNFAKPNAPRKFEHVYDFFQWRNKILSPYYYETPRQVSCPGRKNTRPLPQLPKQFSFTLEQVNDIEPGLDFVQFFQETLDYNNQFFTYQYRAPQASNKYSYYGDRMLREIHDFNTGIAYVIDVQRGNCSIQPIELNGLDDVNSDPTHVRIRSAVEFFYLDKVQPTYEGVKQIRGMDADVWVARRSANTSGISNSVWEWAFLAKQVPTDPQWSSVEGLEATEKGGMPVQLTLTQGSTVSTYYNIYNFEATSPDVLDYSINSCFWNRDRRLFSFRIDGSYAPQVLADIKAFKRGVLTAVVNAAGVSKLRVGQLKVNVGNQILVFVSLLDKAPLAGDSITVKQPMDLTKAGDSLLSTMQNGGFSIIPENKDNGGSATQIPIMMNSVREREYILTPPYVGYSSGVVAGTAVAMATVGLGGGGFLAKLYKDKFM